MSILVQAVRYPFMAIRLWKPHPIAVFMLKLWSPALILLAFCVGKFLIPLLLSNLH